MDYAAVAGRINLAAFKADYYDRSLKLVEVGRKHGIGEWHISKFVRFLGWEHRGKYQPRNGATVPANVPRGQLDGVLCKLGISRRTYYKRLAKQRAPGKTGCNRTCTAWRTCMAGGRSQEAALDHLPCEKEVFADEDIPSDPDSASYYTSPWEVEISVSPNA